MELDLGEGVGWMEEDVNEGGANATAEGARIPGRNKGVIAHALDCSVLKGRLFLPNVRAPSVSVCLSASQ